MKITKLMRILLVALAAIMVFCLFACNETETETESTIESSEIEESENSSTPADSESESTPAESESESTPAESGSESTPACEHTYTYTCDATCAICGELTNPEAAHTIKAVEAKAATCYENGNIAYWYCEICGQAWLDEACTLNTNLKAVVLPMAHAEATHVEAKAATCTELGNIEYWYCEACGQAWLDEACTLNTNLQAVKLPVAEHTYMFECDATCMVCGELTNAEAAHTVKAVEAKAATCTENGNIAYWYCETCGYAWADEALTQVTNSKSVIIPAAHTYTDCADTDCDVCGATRENATHTIIYVEAVVPANCQETGHDEYWTCSACGACFGDAEGSYEVNPAWINYTGECTRPEGAADCATVPCSVCGEDTYGDGEHTTGVAACQDGHCSKCDTDIAGLGCAKYDTPACEDGKCYYCGGDVAGFGHENGAWAPCLDGECSYGCGKTYPATEAHADEDADDFCDNCYSHLNHDVDPCMGGECSICFELIAPAHGNIVHLEAAAPTCTEMGNLECWYCETCGQAWLDEAQTLNTDLKAVKLPAAHTYTYECDKVCAVCYELTNDAAEHNVVAVDAKAATCTADGNIAYWYCEFCGSAWTDEACTQITNAKNVKIAATGHADENGDFKCDACSGKAFPADGTALTIAEAIAIAKVAGTSYTTQKYYITGVIISIANTQYGNLTIRDENGDELYIYGLYSADGKTGYSSMSVKPVKGDEITIYTILGMYNTSVQGKSAWLDELVQHTEHTWVDATCTAPKTCSICDATEGKPIDHVYVEGVCACGKVEGAASLVNATLDFSSKDNRTTFTTSQQVWEQNGVKVTNDKASSSNAVGDYANPARFYQGSKITVEGVGITKVVITTSESKYTTALVNSAKTVAGATVTNSGNVVTITFAEAVDSFTFSCSAQIRMKTIVVN